MNGQIPIRVHSYSFTVEYSVSYGTMAGYIVTGKSPLTKTKVEGIKVTGDDSPAECVINHVKQELCSLGYRTSNIIDDEFMMEVIKTDVRYNE